MTKCSWKYRFIFLLGAFFAVYSSPAHAADAQKDILGGRTLTTDDKIKLDQEIVELEKKEESKRQIMDKACDEYSEAYDDAKGFLNLNDFFFNDWITIQLRNLSPVHDNSWDTYISHFKEKLSTSLMDGDTEQAQKWNNVIQKAELCLDATNQWYGPATTLADKKSIRDHGENVLVYYDEKNKTRVYYVINADGSYEAVAGVTKGCMPLPAKIAEGKNCIFCPLFAQIFSAAQTMATSSFGVLAQSLANVMLVGFALWVAFSLLGKVSSFTKMDAPKYITELLTQAFKVLFAYLMLRNADAVYTYALGPLLKAGMEFGMTLLSSGDSVYLKSCDSMSGVKNMSTNGLLPYYLYTQLDCFIRAIQFELSVPQAIGSSLMCVSRNAGSTGEVLSFPIPDFSMLFQGLIIWVFAWLISLAFAFYLVDATVRLGIVGALMPFLIASWPFKVTSKYTNQGFTMFMNTFFTYAFMGLVVSINIQLMGISLTGGQGGLDAIEEALNGNSVKVLSDLLDIGFAGFLILIASCIFGFKLCGQAAELAGSMAGGGGGSSIAPEIGGMGYNVAKAATLGTGKMAWQGTKLVGNATGVTPKLRQARDKVVSGVSSGLKSLFTFGRATSKSRAPVSRLRGSDAPAPTPSSSSSGGASPVTAEQTRQAERVENAAPRPTTPAKPVTAANTAKPNQAGAEGTAPTSPEAARERQIDQFNRKKAAGLDLANNSEIYKQVSERCGQATANRDAAAQRARNFEAQAKEEKDKATALRQKAQSMADGAEKDAVMRQAGSSDQKADEFTAQAAEERKNEKENDAIVQENLKKMDEMQKEREQSISDKEIDSIMKQRYGNNYRTEQSANINGWNFK